MWRVNPLGIQKSLKKQRQDKEDGAKADRFIFALKVIRFGRSLNQCSRLWS
jgi:hypothetical protein